MKVLQPGNFETGTSTYNFLGKEFYLKNKVPFFILDPFFFLVTIDQALKYCSFSSRILKENQSKTKGK